MAQTATMGPPLSPRETRRSGRRSAPSVSASASKSPDSDQPPREKLSGSRTTSSSTNNRSKKLKQEDHDEIIDDRKQQGAISGVPSGSASGSNNNKAKRKPKEKDSDKPGNIGQSSDVEVVPGEGQIQEGQEEEEEQGITRCVCGSAEDDPDAGEFMVQCETCKVWQHGLCMGYISEDQVHDDDYYCELCRPQMHEDLLKQVSSLAKRPRQTSATSRHDTTSAQRVSRSRSPSHLMKQASKRRNTMNSRDAAFDESLKEIIEATAAEAAAVQDVPVEDILSAVPDITDNGKKKRKRTDEDNISKKRTRSASTASDGQRRTAPPADSIVVEKAPPVAKPSGGRNRRGGRKIPAIEIAAVDSEEALSTSGKRAGNHSRVKPSNAPKRPPISQSISHGSGVATHEHGTRRNQLGSSAVGQQSGTSAADARAYRNSHAYAVSQQTLFTSWNLPDYLSHLEQMLPTDIPQPLEVRAGATSTGSSNSRGESADRTMERGVKVKWPAKRMSVGDMNKRVRALVEWVGREQASALDRGRRREALEKALREQAATLAELHDTSEDPVLPGCADNSMVIDHQPSSSDQQMQQSKNSVEMHLMPESALEVSSQTMKTMEELMEELIGFQERFGPGAKARDRERRLAA
ncbi:hypothetical protein HYPSUDRAFT_143174 [Hypholoma sublateritium FD-334 SS-4]|uniref:PHD-type domain-containing protein n=1 Tax=Hypholoma sublateritium (strain FD-334 SS-4) TaxID=945553 RepID=A0A0D2M972_HYPSF|nr:hypothetical protein HYPSUDRAFT_143174 [Hypholoma sublateritium FD-334 SS-4]